MDKIIETIDLLGTCITIATPIYTNRKEIYKTFRKVLGRFKGRF